MESIVDKIRSRIDLLNTLYPHEHGRYYVDHEYGGYKLFSPLRTVRRSACRPG